MKINERLKTIGDLVPLSSYPLDVGCDHALLSIYLVKERGLKKVVASDNKEGPLQKAKENITFYDTKNKIELILAEGLSSYKKGVDTLTISGLGGLSINQILEQSSHLLSNFTTIILSPNNYTTLVREKMYQFGFSLIEEMVVKERHIIYPVLVFTRGKSKMSSKDLFLGPILKTKEDPLTEEYYQRQVQEKKQLLALLPKNHIKKRWHVKKELKWLKKRG